MGCLEGNSLEPALMLRCHNHYFEVLCIGVSLSFFKFSLIVTLLAL